MAKIEIPFFDTEVAVMNSLPSLKRLAQPLASSPEVLFLVYDIRLKKNPVLAAWIKQFAFSYPVKGGETLKSLDDLPKHMRKIFKIMGPVATGRVCFVSFGGGTVGDFAGFLASIFKRGVPVIHVPSTLLSAIDSSHGGKTGLNMGEFKNQIGSFHHAKAVFVVKEVFEKLPKAQVQSAVGELLKMALIEGGEIFKKFQDATEMNFDKVWGLLPLAIEGKYKTIVKDPLEQSGERQLLNLGHSMGHVIESYYGLPHGYAVFLGLEFSINWSVHRGILKKAQSEEILKVFDSVSGLERAAGFFKKNRKLSKSRVEKILSQDKKLKNKQSLHYIFIEGAGKPLRKSVTLDSVLNEAERQKWT